MDQQQRREFLLRFLLGENKRYEGKSIPPSPEGQRKLLRALMNLRPPKPVPEEVLAVQDDYLKERLSERGVASLSALPGCALAWGHHHPAGVRHRQRRKLCPSGLLCSGPPLHRQRHPYLCRDAAAALLP